jgi:hypothetical protein
MTDMASYPFTGQRATLSQSAQLNSKVNVTRSENTPARRRGPSISGGSPMTLQSAWPPILAYGQSEASNRAMPGRSQPVLGVSSLNLNPVGTGTAFANGAF